MEDRHTESSSGQPACGPEYPAVIHAGTGSLCKGAHYGGNRELGSTAMR